MAELASCPYCGGSKIRMHPGFIAGTPAPGQTFRARSFYYVECDSCGCHTGPKDTGDEACAVWSRRPADYSRADTNSLWFHYRHPSELH